MQLKQCCWLLFRNLILPGLSCGWVHSFGLSCATSLEEESSNVVDNLHCAKDGEACEESHGAADQTQLGVDCHLHISFNVVVGPRVKVDLNHLQGNLNCSVYNKNIMYFLNKYLLR